MSQRAKEKYFPNNIQRDLIVLQNSQSWHWNNLNNNYLVNDMYFIIVLWQLILICLSSPSHIYYSLYILYNSKVQVANDLGNENGILVLYTEHDFLDVTDKIIL